MKYMIMMYGSQQDYDAMTGKPVTGKPAWSAAEAAAMGAFMESYNRALAEAGELVETRGLAAPAHARRIQVRDGVRVVTDGPYPEAQEVLAGYWIVECDGIDRAIEIAAGLTACPGPTGVGADGFADVRPLLDGRADLDV